jgi:hypothetical protein
MTLKDTEFEILRDTIARRGTVRHVLLPVAVIGWGLVTAAALSVTGIVTASLLSLGALVAGFEAIHALHVGVERVGRYLQVFYENGGDGPRWESAAMRAGPGLPGGGVDPLFTLVFAGATAVNIVLLPFPPRQIWPAVVLAAHALFLVRLGRARRAAAQQRAVDLETFTAIRAQLLKTDGDSR